MRKFLGYLGVAALVAGLYLGAIYLPIYIDHLDAKDILNSTFNQYRELRSAEAVTHALLSRYNEVQWATHVAFDEYGDKRVVPGLGLTEDDLVVEFNDQTKVLDVRVTYTRIVEFKPSDKVRKMTFVLERHGKPPNVY